MKPRYRESKCRACGAESVELVQDDCYEAVVAWCKGGHVVVHRDWDRKTTSLVYDFAGTYDGPPRGRSTLFAMLHDRVSRMDDAELRELVEYRLPTYKKEVEED